MKDVTVVVNSCDKYKDCWLPFFQCYEKNWNPGYPIVLVAESESYSYGDLPITAFQLYQNQQTVSWSELRMETLRRISTPYIIFLLDDFFLEHKVDQETIEQCVSWMNENPDVSVFYFEPIGAGSNLDDHRFPGFERRPEKCEYKLNCQAALWRREKLIEYMRPHESAWYFETLGSRRASRYHESFYSRSAAAPSIMEYHYEIGGALHRGKWNREVIEECGKAGIMIDTGKRGINDMVSGSRKSRWAYYLSRMNPRDITRGLIARWKSLK